VIAAHRPLAHFVDWYTETFRIGPGDRFAVASGVAHDPLLRDLVVPLCVGATACVPAPDVHRQPDELARWMRGEQVTIAHLTPQLARLLASTGETLPELRLLATGGDVLRQADVAALGALAPIAELVAFYGATETPQAAGWQSVRQAGPGRTQVPLGIGIAGTQLLVQGGHGGPAGVGELGEIVVRSPHVALGYLGDPERTAARFIARPGDPGRGYRTGDLGRYLPDGRVEFAGRRDSQVKVRGHRVELGEVTAVLERHTQVRQALVVALDGPDDDTRLVAYVVPRDGARPQADDLKRHLNALLPPYAVPAAVVPIGRIPLAPNGKVDLGALPRPQVRASAFTAPRNRAEQAVAQVWRDVLGTGPVGLDDNFFDLGGSSLHLVKVQRRLTAELQAPLTIIDLFRYPTVRGLAALLTPPTSDETSSTQPDASAERVTRRTERRRARRARRQA
jgi:acyl-coenzyme A synthetase/AMP-(fatty) acid ligase